MVTDFKKKQKGNPYKKIVIGLLGVGILTVAIFLVVANAKMYQKRQELDYQVQSLQNKISELKAKNAGLQEGISESNSNQYLEKVAREELDMQQPDEKVISFVVPQAKEQAATPQQQNMWQSWLGWVSGWFKR